VTRSPVFGFCSSGGRTRITNVGRGQRVRRRVLSDSRTWPTSVDSRSNFRLCCFCNSCSVEKAAATQQHGVGFRFHFFEFLKPQFRAILLIVSVWWYYNQLCRVQRPGLQDGWSILLRQGTANYSPWTALIKISLRLILIF
jgi:hypothetical protein